MERYGGVGVLADSPGSWFPDKLADMMVWCRLETGWTGMTNVFTGDNIGHTATASNLLLTVTLTISMLKS